MESAALKNFDFLLTIWTHVWQLVKLGKQHAYLPDHKWEAGSRVPAAIDSPHRRAPRSSAGQRQWVDIEPSAEAGTNS